MDLFSRHVLSDHAERPSFPAPVAAQPLSIVDQQRFEELAEVVCDEEAIDPG
jgi:hypothetical protein